MSTRFEKNHFVICNCPFWGRGPFFSCYSILLKNRPKRPRFSGRIKFIVSKTILSLILTLTPILTIKLKFKLVIFWMRCHQISSVAVCIGLTEFLDNIIKMPIFKPEINFFEGLIANMVNQSNRVMAIYIFLRCFEFKGSKSWKYHASKICVPSDCGLKP